MNAPMVGSWSVEVHAVHPFSIHGDLYYELHVSKLDDPAKVFTIKVPQHAVTGEPSQGQTLSVNFLMGQVTSAKPL